MLTIDQLFQGLGVPCSPKLQVIDVLTKAGLIEESVGGVYSPESRGVVASFMNLRRTGYTIDAAISFMAGSMALAPTALAAQVPETDYRKKPYVKPRIEAVAGSAGLAGSVGLPGAIDVAVAPPLALAAVRKTLPVIKPANVVLLGSARSGKAHHVAAGRTALPPPVPASVKTHTEILHLKNLVFESKLEVAAILEESRRKMQEWDEERRNSRARLARLEVITAKKKAEGLMGRLKSAWRVLLGYEVKLPALPARSSASSQTSASPDTEIRWRIAA